jgi:hypothetical protein
LSYVKYDLSFYQPKTLDNYRLFLHDQSIKTNVFMNLKMLNFLFRPLPVEVILDKARRALNQEGYNLVYSNCEHFTTECRYGQANSRQVRKYIF